MTDSIGLMLRSPPCPQGEVGVSKHEAAPSFETPAFRRAPQDEAGQRCGAEGVLHLMRRTVSTASVGSCPAIGVAPSAAHAAALDGAQLNWPWALPFLGILLTIATGPLLFPRIWHRHYGKLAFAWATLTLAPMAALYGLPTAVAALVHAAFGEYLSFIVLLFALYVVAGGILVTGNL